MVKARIWSLLLLFLLIFRGHAHGGLLCLRGDEVVHAVLIKVTLQQRAEVRGLGTLQYGGVARTQTHFYPPRFKHIFFPMNLNCAAKWQDFTGRRKHGLPFRRLSPAVNQTHRWSRPRRRDSPLLTQQAGVFWTSRSRSHRGTNRSFKRHQNGMWCYLHRRCTPWNTREKKSITHGCFFSVFGQ